MKVEIVENDDEMDDAEQQIKIKGGLLPGLQVSPPRSTNYGIALTDDGDEVEVFCQSIRCKTNLALSTK